VPGHPARRREERHGGHGNAGQESRARHGRRAPRRQRPRRRYPRPLRASRRAGGKLEGRRVRFGEVWG
jgi:hypothetical protein